MAVLEFDGSVQPSLEATYPLVEVVSLHLESDAELTAMFDIRFVINLPEETTDEQEEAAEEP